MTLIRNMVDYNRIQIRIGELENDVMFEAMAMVYNRAACNIGLEKIVSAKPDEEES